MAQLAVVCGATGAIGRPIVRALAERDLTVLAIARRSAGLEALAGDVRRVESLVADVEDDAITDQLRQKVGQRDVRVVVNAAAVPLTGDILTCDLSAITAAVNVKVNGLVRLVRGVLPRLVPDARIIGIGGSFGYDPSPAASSGGISNAGLANLIRQLARTLGAEGVTCHVVAPGPVRTERLLSLVEREAANAGIAVEEVLAQRASATARGSLTAPEEVAAAVCALLEPWAATTTGSTWFLDGGARTATP